MEDVLTLCCTDTRSVSERHQGEDKVSGTCYSNSWFLPVQPTTFYLAHTVSSQILVSQHETAPDSLHLGQRPRLRNKGRDEDTCHVLVPETTVMRLCRRLKAATEMENQYMRQKASAGIR